MSEPSCPRCGCKMKILFHVERYCPNDCDKMPPGQPCPKCGSTVTEEFVTLSFFGPDETKMHCWPCGATWTDEQKPETD